MLRESRPRRAAADRYGPGNASQAEGPPGTLADREGFEPSVRLLTYDGLAIRWFKPLTHLSREPARLTESGPAAQRPKGGRKRGPAALEPGRGMCYSRAGANPVRSSMVRSFLIAAAVAGLLAGCGDAKVEHDYPDPLYRHLPGSHGSSYRPKEGAQGIFGEDGISLLGGDREQGGGAGIGVNSFLWRASLDTLSFMPLASADPFGGVIITDWFAPPETPDERFKVTVYILDRELRASGLKVAVFRQEKGEAGWADAAVDGATHTEVENSILVRARELRIASL